MGRKVQKQIKVVQILARYAYKSNGVFTGLVSYKVRSSDGKNCYCTTLLHGEAVGCSCPALVTCYHMTQLEVIEQARRAEAALSAIVAAQEVIATVPPAATLKTLPRAATAVMDKLTTAQPADIGQRGSLNSNAHSAVTSLVHGNSSIERSLPACFLK